jgi:uncharacterized protein YdhG (YjbR/CyaY superfamily)
VKRAAGTIDVYLAGLPAAQRATLQRLRTTIRRIVPQAQECISYRIPAFRLEGGIVAGFLARKDGFSYVPFSGRTLATLARELEGYGGTKSALHFEKPLPASLVRKLIRARMAEMLKGGD